jgi:hypothetical protein
VLAVNIVFKLKNEFCYLDSLKFSTWAVINQLTGHAAGKCARNEGEGEAAPTAGRYARGKGNLILQKAKTPALI